MAKLSDKKASIHSHVMVFGAPKSGKTELVGKLSKRYKLLWFDLENGIDTLKKLPPEWQERIEYIQIPDTRSFPIAIQTLLKVIKGGKYEICEEHGAISCPICKKAEKPSVTVNLDELDEDTIVVVDSGTQLTNSAIAHITKGIPDPENYKLQYDDWAKLGMLMDIFFGHIQNGKYKAVVISHETEVEMEDGKLKLVPTAGTRNFSRNTAKYFSDVVFCEVKNKKHVAASSTTYSGNILTGSRSGTILEAIEAEDALVAIFDPEYRAEQIAKVQTTKSSTPQTSSKNPLDRLKSIT